MKFELNEKQAKEIIYKTLVENDLVEEVGNYELCEKIADALKGIVIKNSQLKSALNINQMENEGFRARESAIQKILNGETPSWEDDI